MPLETARENILQQIVPIFQTQRVPLLKANKRICAEDVLSTVSVPPNDNSAMDGYAIKNVDADQGTRLTLVGKSMAGSPFDGELLAGQCVRIMTGAVIPNGAEAVIMQEQVLVEGDQIVLQTQVAPGNNVRLAGEDIKQGAVVIKKGTLLTPAHLSLVASVGVSKVSVVRKPKVALIATGDELTAPGEVLGEGAIYESNRYALHAMLENHGADVLDLGIVPDDEVALKDAFIEAARKCDLIVTSGGVSVGDADLVKPVLAELGQIDFWKIAVKPGKPFAYGKLGKAHFCGLPGNPVSSYVTFQLLVIPLLRKLHGLEVATSTTLTAETENPVRKRPGRADFQRGTYFRAPNGKLKVIAGTRQGSGIMTSITQANCYLIVPQESGNLPQGSEVEILPFAFLDG